METIVHCTETLPEIVKNLSRKPRFVLNKQMVQTGNHANPHLPFLPPQQGFICDKQLIFEFLVPYVFMHKSSYQLATCLSHDDMRLV